jgi:hypothetical protein
VTTVTRDAPGHRAENEGRPGDLARLRDFMRIVFEPRLHTAFAAAWTLSLLGELHVVSGTRAGAGALPWRVDARAAVLVVSVFLCLFFLRMVDEVKDHAYDVVHNPGRPLVTGLVTRRDIARYLTVLALMVPAANAALAWPLGACLAVDLLYGIFQIALERWSRVVRESLPWNLVAVYPVNVGLSIYTLLFFVAQTGVHVGVRHALLVVAYACAFLHFEFARKSGWPHLAMAGERLYSQSWGLAGSLAVASLFGFTALGLAVTLLAPWACVGAASVTGWLPLLALVPMGIGLALFARHRDARHAARPPAVAFLFTFYATMLLHAVVASGVAWGSP